MTSADEYRRQISALGVDSLETQPSSRADAKATLAHVRSARKELRQIKRNINLDMRAIKAEYRQRLPKAAADSPAAETLPAAERKRLVAERAQKLGRYGEVKLTVDELLTQMDGAKVQLREFIQEAKAAGQAKKGASTAKRKE
ncbi:MAG TPA: hypothetical protein VM537_00780 [Anaerolineae bacterium]|jgi:hypothetical protein|nr:hypothetical protein [Anaerolineae bacterium]